MPEGRSGANYHTSYAPNAYSIERACGLPVLIPCGLQDETLRGIYERLDALFIPGGPDVDPKNYNAEPHPALGNVDPIRDATELKVIRWAVDDDLPIFGVCRGHQVMNVALGGTLIQDIPSLVQTDLLHDQEKGLSPARIAHEVTIQPDSRLAEIVGSTRIEVNSLHHQAVERAAPNTHVTAYSPDGVVEALELPDHNFVLSVQWHPEVMYVQNGDAASERLFTAFVNAARESALRKQAVR